MSTMAHTISLEPSSLDCSVSERVCVCALPALQQVAQQLARRHKELLTFMSSHMHVKWDLSTVLSLIRDLRSLCDDVYLCKVEFAFVLHCNPTPPVLLRVRFHFLCAASRGIE